MKYRPLERQVAIVTGAGHGLGRAIADALAQAGAIVAIAEIDESAGRAAVEELNSHGHQAWSYQIDVCKGGQVQAMLDDLLRRHGQVDILVNNAGLPAGGPSQDVTEETWDRLHGVMLKGLFGCCQIIGREMLRRGSGKIVNICSRSAVGGWAERAAYTSAKAGAIAITQVLGVEWARYGVRVNGINPGQFVTRHIGIDAGYDPEELEAIIKRAPASRFGTLEEITEVVVFLVGDEASYVNAEVINVDGGWLAWGGIEEATGI